MTIRIVEFKTQYRPGKDPVDMVLLAPQGDGFEKTRTWHRVEKLRPPENVTEKEKERLSHIDMVSKWAIIGPAYEAWQSGNAPPESGTPLAAWAGVTQEQAEFMRKMGIRSVEDVRDMGEGAVEQLRWPGSRKLPALAGEFLKSETAAQKDAKLAEMTERMAALEALLEETMQDKPRRGRPPKVKEPEGEAA